MNEKDIEWFEKCKNEPEKYKIYVDNDDISVVDVKYDECVHTFATYGYEFVLDLLNQIGCNAEPV